LDFWQKVLTLIDLQLATTSSAILPNPLECAPGVATSWQRQLPRRRGSHSDANGSLLSFCHADERRLDVHRGRSKGVNDLEHELRRDVSRAQVDRRTTHSRNVALKVANA
jgi:hypothetical protein